MCVWAMSVCVFIGCLCRSNECVFGLCVCVCVCVCVFLSGCPSGDDMMI